MLVFREARPSVAVTKREILMRSTEKIACLTADHLEERAAAKIRDAERLPPGDARQHALKNAAQLRSYAAMKRYLAPLPPTKAAAE